MINRASKHSQSSSVSHCQFEFNDLKKLFIKIFSLTHTPGSKAEENRNYINRRDHERINKRRLNTKKNKGKFSSPQTKYKI